MNKLHTHTTFLCLFTVNKNHYSNRIGQNLIQLTNNDHIIGLNSNNGQVSVTFVVL